MLVGVFKFKRWKKGERRKEQRAELAKWSSLTEDTPRDAVKNVLRLHLHNFAYKTIKIKKKKKKQVQMSNRQSAPLTLGHSAVAVGCFPVAHSHRPGGFCARNGTMAIGGFCFLTANTEAAERSQSSQDAHLHLAFKP
jgi:hypothetical protein